MGVRFKVPTGDNGWGVLVSIFGSIGLSGLIGGLGGAGDDVLTVGILFTFCAVVCWFLSFAKQSKI